MSAASSTFDIVLPNDYLFIEFKPSSQGYWPDLAFRLVRSMTENATRTAVTGAVAEASDVSVFDAVSQSAVHEIRVHECDGISSEVRVLTAGNRAHSAQTVAFPMSILINVATQHGHGGGRSKWQNDNL
ncbi:hypothetical protein SISSUDRAFT_1121471 [Sistotremastrum suecicum HHB10207 ss-3]|uniref:Uncharacterized protein n=1 Tax=Sistotremastrum suecicum HHB10207 ss-3 TaxID=1314776 RepID=A0A166AS41_9AGAM|nr:hypothetical protein SISSUDRAFT_1121471 [Sistotremastrum suecicum HHB10207 ss-3]